MWDVAIFVILILGSLAGAIVLVVDKLKELENEKKRPPECQHVWDIDIGVHNITSTNSITGKSVPKGHVYIRECSKCHELREFDFSLK